MSPNVMGRIDFRRLHEPTKLTFFVDTSTKRALLGCQPRGVLVALVYIVSRVQLERNVVCVCLSVPIGSNFTSMTPCFVTVDLKLSSPHQQEYVEARNWS